ncbi:MAG: prepilin-type N-terminal cleavage/methylation domain-containing protein [Planctomycetota bacterium]|nr:MAG: prepilin-type N-terminal cleavage/methylation domain-containing protein [Planctomycetota bacterium]
MELRVKCDLGDKGQRGFSLIELLVVAAIIAVVIAILVPALNNGRRNARAMQTMNNQRQIVFGVTGFASDNNGKYPQSVATVGSTERWNWQEPTMLTSYRRRDPQMPRSMSAYLRSYITDASVMFCPNAPRKYEYLQQAWDAGDEWDNPETAPEHDPVMGTYCFYWNYVGLLGVDRGRLKGPADMSRGQEESRLLVSDYFGYGHWRNKLIYNTSEAYGSCEKMRGARITPGTAVSSAFWSRRVGTGDVSQDVRQVELHAGYTDGHVERYRLADAVAMKVSKTDDGSAAYPEELGPGQFYVPENALY